MPVNFGILTPQDQTPKITMGSLPTGSAPPAPPREDIGKDLMGGLLQGQQFSQNRQAGEMNQMKLQEMQQVQADQQTLRTLATEATTPEEYDNKIATAYKAMGRPELYQNYIKGQQDLQNSKHTGEGIVLDNQGKVEKNKQDKLDNVVKNVTQVGSVTIGLAGLPPSQMQEEYKKQYKFLDRMSGGNAPKPNADPSEIQAWLAGAGKFAVTKTGDLAKIYPADTQALSPNADANITALNSGSEDKNTTNNQKDLRRQANLESKQKSGALTPQEQTELTGLQNIQMNKEGQSPFAKVNVLRDEVNKQAKPFIDVNDAYGRIIASAKDPSAAGDLALVFNYMKMLDPGSTVREGEFANAQNSAGIPDRIRAMYNKSMNGERLAPDTRADFVNRAGQLYKSQEQSYQQVIDQYSEKAKRMGLDPKDVVVDVRVKSRGDAANGQGSGITIRNKTTGETKTVTAEEAKKMGLM